MAESRAVETGSLTPALAGGSRLAMELARRNVLKIVREGGWGRRPQRAASVVSSSGETSGALQGRRPQLHFLLPDLGRYSGPYTMRFSCRAFVLLAVFAAALVGVGVALSTGLISAKPTIPRIEFTDSVDLGSCAQGGIAEGRFLVKNVGGGELTVEAFRTSCSCAGVEREVDGKFLRVQSLRLGAGEEVELVVRVSVTASAGQRQRIGIAFDTNDPECPRGIVDALVSRVLGGVVSLPSAVSCGDLTVGSQATFTLDIYDNGQTGRLIGEVRSTCPERFGAFLVPLAGANSTVSDSR